MRGFIFWISIKGESSASEIEGKRKQKTKHNNLVIPSEAEGRIEESFIQDPSASLGMTIVELLYRRSFSFVVSFLLPLEKRRGIQVLKETTGAVAGIAKA